MMTAKEAAMAAFEKNYSHVDEDKQFHEIMDKIEKAAKAGKNQVSHYFVLLQNEKRFATLGYQIQSNIDPEDGIHNTIFQWWLK